MASILSFAIEPLEQGKSIFSITPVVNGRHLTGLIEEYERGRAFEPLGGYAGLVPSNFKFGPLDRYFLADTSMNHLEVGGHYLLGCTCGEVGCWPLTGRISVSKETVVWDRFRQPHRPNRDYSGFGPFVFEIEQYRAAIKELATKFPDNPES